ncbi:MAG: recombinase family protein [Chloroflexota bacterium]
MKRAILYARVSGDDRTNSTSSLEGQLELCRKYAKDNGWEIVGELAEDFRGASGADWNLPQINKALDLAKEGQFDVLVARELDRLARDLAKQLVLETEFKRYGVNIKYAVGDYDDSLDGDLTKRIRGVIAEYERLKISERMVRGRRRKAQSGYVVLHGNAPYGYVADKTEAGVLLKVDPKIAEIIKMIFDWYLHKGWGTPKISKKLNALGVPPPSAIKNRGETPKAKKWNYSQVLRILKNKTYMGEWMYGKRRRRGENPSDYHITVKVPSIISKEMYELAQEKVKSNAKLSTRNTKRQYLLAKRCFCKLCQTSMSSFTKIDRNKPYSYYRCPVKSIQETHYAQKTCEARKHYRVNYWDIRVWEEIKSFLSHPEKFKIGIREFQSDQEEQNTPLYERMNIIDELISKKNDELTRLLDLYLSGEFSKELLHDRKNHLERTLEALVNEKITLESQISSVITDDQISELEEFASQIAEGFLIAENDFETKRKIIDYLGVKVIFSYEDGIEIADVYCDVGHIKMLVMGQELPTLQNSSRQPLSPTSTNSPLEGSDSYRSIGMHSTDCTHN